MDSFEDLGLAPELIDLLAASGIERPTPFQEQALPLVRRGNNVVGRAGPGAGTLVAWGAGLLERLTAEGDPEAEDRADEGGAPGEDERADGSTADQAAETDQPAEPGAEGAGPRAVVLTPTGDVAERLAESLARLAAPLGVRVAAVGGSWVLPERADVLFGTAPAVLGWLREGRTSLQSVEAVVVDQLTAVASLQGLPDLDTLFEFVDRDAQRIVLDVPTRDVRASDAREAADGFLERHVRRGMHVPPRAVEDEEDVPDRGSLAYRIVEEPKDGGGLGLVAELIGERDLRHLVVFFRSDDEAADVGDFLALHGFASGAPGDASAPVWLAVDDMEARTALDAVEDTESVAVLSWDVPAGPDSLDRRHGAGRGGWVLVLPREVPHLRDVSRRTGYRLQPAPPPAESRVHDDLVDTVERVAAALEEEDVGAYLLVLETLFEDHDPAEVAAAAVALLRKRPPPAGAPVTSPTPSAEPPATRKPAAGTPAGARGPAWVKLFVSIGRKDGAGPGDIVGAVAGETAADASRIGRIEIRETFSIVEVEEGIAEEVIRGLNGTTVKGRSVRVDYDRPGGRRDEGRGGSSKGRGSRRPGGGGRSGGGGRRQS